METSKLGTLIIIRHPTVAPLGFAQAVSFNTVLPDLSPEDQARVKENQIYQTYMENPVVQTALAGDPTAKVEKTLFSLS